jgi:hypothetical protein
MWDNFGISEKLFIANNRPMVENSTNLVTLVVGMRMVTRLGENSPIGRLFTSVSFIEILSNRPNFGRLFPRV